MFINMDYILPTFKIVSVTFAISAVVTGVQAIVDPRGFARSFGIPVTAAKQSKTYEPSPKSQMNTDPVMAYVSLMGVRQLATGVTLLLFAYQRKWMEMATILSILGILVAGTDGVYLARSGAGGKARFHAIPGALIALLSGVAYYTNA